ncbi:MAG: AIPR family protein [Prevotella sp.]|nr:AIPR family protein [Prevotella sp.]
MKIEEFRAQFMQELRLNAEHEGTAPEVQFVNHAIELLEEIGDVSDVDYIPVEIRGKKRRMMAFDAFAYDEADGALVLIACDFTNEMDNVHTLTNTRIDDLCNRMKNFIDESVNGRISDYCDDSDRAITIAADIKRKFGTGMLNTEIMRFKFIILSNSLLSTQVKNISRENFLERPVELNIWTLERFFQTYTSNSSEIIEFDTSEFGCDGIQCLKADIGDETNYEAYLGIVPGGFLANAYLKHGSKLLQGNVRAFLSIRGKVNKGIRNTIINSPQNFFTYNNGIAVVARSVKFSEDRAKIIHFKDFQIINGGQTTASLANAVIKKEKTVHEMSNLFVPMKLTVLNVEEEMSEDEMEKYNDITKQISECANSQNAVSEADFFSNHPYHVLMENLSIRTLAPPVDGKPYQTIWYYERSRGKWEQNQMQLSPSQRITFCSKQPKNQVIKKEKLAKCLNSFAMKPHEVCQSSAINFKHFAGTISDLYDKSRDSINEIYYKKCVCCVIVFDSLDRIINRSNWYPSGGNKAQIVPYSIAKLMSILPKGQTLDWTSIWKKQSMYPALEEELGRIAFIIHNFLTGEASGGLVRSMSRRADTWEKCKKIKIDLSDQFLGSLIPTEEIKSEEQQAKRASKFNSSIDLAVQIFNLGTVYWRKVYSLVWKEHILNDIELQFINGIANYIGRKNLPTSSQCKKLLKIINKLEDKGFIMP